MGRYIEYNVYLTMDLLRRIEVFVRDADGVLVGLDGRLAEVVAGAIGVRERCDCFFQLCQPWRACSRWCHLEHCTKSYECSWMGTLHACLSYCRHQNCEYAGG